MALQKIKFLRILKNIKRNDYNEIAFMENENDDGIGETVEFSRRQ